MANKIQQRRGLKANMPTLSAGEIGYATDTRETFIGTGSGNVNMGGSHWYRGTAMSGTVTTTGYYSFSACPQVKVDDMYLNTSNGNVYACTTAGSGTSAKWTYQGSIKGVTGANGSNATVTVDNSLSGTSTNPVQNKVIRSALINVAAAFSKPMPIDYYNENLEAAHINNSCTPLPGQIYLAYGVSEGNYSVLEDLDNYLWYINTYIKTNDVVLLRIDSNPESEERAGQCTVIATL